MTVPTVSEFRTRFQIFKSDPDYPDAVIKMYLDEAALEISEAEFRGHYPLAVMLFAAHNLALETSATEKALAGGKAEVSGAIAAVGGLNSASVGDVSVSMNLKAPESEVWGNLGATMFGQRLMSIMKKVCRGGLVVTQSANLSGGVIV